jgi:putative glutamine amidotransferase
MPEARRTRPRPVIGYTIELEDPLLPETETALRAPLERAGALPVVLPRDTPVADVDELLDLVHGVQLCGGADVDPSHYGQEPHPATSPIDTEHDAFELALARRALERGMPILGICRGIQVLAVADGGVLTQDVADLHEGAHMHRYSWRELALAPPGEHWHDVEVQPGSRAESWFADGERRVNSFHHQAVAGTGTRLAATVRTQDGVIEAIERVDGQGWAAGLQWHNEMMWRHDARFLRPHAELVDEARRIAAARGNGG